MSGRPKSPCARQRNRLLAAAGATGLAAPLLLTAGQFVTVSLMGAFLGGLGTLLVRTVDESRDAASADGLLDAAGKALAGAALAVTATMLVTLFGGYGWLAVGMLALACPLLRVIAGRGSTSTLEPLPSEYRAWTTADLAAAWMASGRQVEAARSPEERARLAATRRHYLDELERRDPEGVRRWLELGADADGDPRRFLSS